MYKLFFYKNNISCVEYFFLWIHCKYYKLYLLSFQVYIVNQNATNSGSTNASIGLHLVHSDGVIEFEPTQCSGNITVVFTDNQYSDLNNWNNTILQIKQKLVGSLLSSQVHIISCNYG